MCVFVFKQKTAYEMRIRDWSSDVCSSDLAGLFGMRNMPADQVQPFLLAEAPRLLFPFARRILADAVRDGGFPPLLLEPIAFGALYMQQAETAQAQPGGPGAARTACRNPARERATSLRQERATGTQRGRAWYREGGWETGKKSVGG